ncbi:hypothetical protein OHD62_18535 [Mesorhizobium sp. YC-39]|uniref:hypothetical protein n=1 Tax=unclassified Mesorhizobium TaxID=325217 RepID=UPI0021E78742|nr:MULTISPECIES: hypothetical protein [unclassified Mesorhizobium]MCV3209843.1 hypothetical protein [Mesorhizobium sp. YC-2]MCV3230373.1 hypothetical protein [Mesorhizobium sp. YC-39]
MILDFGDVFLSASNAGHHAKLVMIGLSTGDEIVALIGCMEQKSPSKVAIRAPIDGGTGNG